MVSGGWCHSFAKKCFDSFTCSRDFPGGVGEYAPNGKPVEEAGGSLGLLSVDLSVAIISG